MKPQKIALFHPWLKSRGGAEKVVLEILKNDKNNIDLYTWAYDKENTFEEFRKYKINIISPKFGKKLSRFYLLRGLFLPLSLLKKIPLEKYDKFLISTSGVGEFITFRNYKKGKTYAYVHTPLREADDKIVNWNLKNRYNSFFKKQIYLFAVKVYKIFEKKAWKRLDVVIFNSELNKKRAKERNLLGNKKVKIIYPIFDLPKREKNVKKNKSFVYISRINPPKRQDVLIEAWKKFSKKHKGYKLILVGNRDNKKYYEKIVKMIADCPSIELEENLPNNELKKIISVSLAGIFLGYREDFGMVPLEIISAGKPLIAVDEGGYSKLIKNHPLFHKIKEKHSNKEMIFEITKELEEFIKKDFSKVKTKKLKLNNFTKEIDEVLGE